MHSLIHSRVVVTTATAAIELAAARTLFTFAVSFDYASEAAPIVFSTIHLKNTAFGGLFRFLRRYYRLSIRKLLDVGHIVAIAVTGLTSLLDGYIASCSLNTIIFIASIFAIVIILLTTTHFYRRDPLLLLL